MPSLARFALDNQVVVVTGAGRGIGRVIATEAVESGEKIAVGSRTTTELANLAAEGTASGGGVLAFRIGCRRRRF